MHGDVYDIPISHQNATKLTTREKVSVHWGKKKTVHQIFCWGSWRFFGLPPPSPPQFPCLGYNYIVTSALAIKGNQELYIRPE